MAKAFSLGEQWAEAFTLFFLIIGFVLAIGLRNSYFSYLSVFLSGALAARLFYERRYREPILPFVLIILGFLLGYLIGSFFVSRLWNLVFFGIGFGLSYYLHQKKIFAIFKNDGFIK